MRRAIAAALSTAILGTTISVFAAEGDRWAVDRQNINVRAGPSTSADILMTINPGENIIEIASKGDWYFVEFPNRNKRGWVFGELLVKPEEAKPVAAATPEPAPASTRTEVVNPSAAAVQQQPAIAASPTPEAPETPTAGQADDQLAAAVPVDDEPAAVKSFRDTVAELNSRAVSVAGINLFNDVRSTGGGGVQVLATETWASVPEAGQSSYMNALFDRWRSVANGLGPVSLQIVDPSGKVMMERNDS